MFTIGYEDVSKKVKAKPFYIRNCNNCEFFYQTEEDSEELCQNPQVLQFDIVVEDTRVFCLQWELVSAEIKKVKGDSETSWIKRTKKSLRKI